MTGTASQVTSRTNILNYGVLKLVAGWSSIALVFMAPALLFDPYWIYLSTLTLTYLLAAQGLNLMLGYAGQISLAQGAFAGVGAYTVAILGKWGWPLWETLPLGTVLGFGLGMIVGLPSIRVRSHYLAMVTLGVNVIFTLVAMNQVDLTGGVFGIAHIARPTLGPLNLTSDPAYHVFVAVIVLVALLALYWILNSPWGRAFKGIRENEVRAAMLGVNIRNYKLVAFAAGSALASLGGALFAPLLGYVDPSAFQFLLSINVVLMVVLGGSGRFEGPFFGAITVVMLPEVLRVAEGLFVFLFGLATIAILMFMPRGLATLWDLAFKVITRRPAPTLTK